MISFQMYNSLVTKWKHGIGTNDITTFNDELENISISIIELVNIIESSHKEAMVILITKTYLNISKNICVT